MLEAGLLLLKKLVLLSLYLSQIGKKNILFDVEPETYENVTDDADQIVAHILAQTKPGSILLLHSENEGGWPRARHSPA